MMLANLLDHEPWEYLFIFALTVLVIWPCVNALCNFIDRISIFGNPVKTGELPRRRRYRLRRREDRHERTTGA